VTYQAVLPNVFPHRFLVPHILAKQMITQLLDFDTELHPIGSSFAVTVDVYLRNVREHLYLWLSDASLQHLEECPEFDNYFADPPNVWHRPKVDWHD
jgi:hypothetical protein